MEAPSIDLCDSEGEKDVVWVLDDDEEPPNSLQHQQQGGPAQQSDPPQHSVPSQQQSGAVEAQHSNPPPPQQQGLYVLDCGCQHGHAELSAQLQRQAGRCRELLERARTAADLADTFRQCLCCVYCSSLLSAQDTYKLLGAAATSDMYTTLAGRLQQLTADANRRQQQVKPPTSQPEPAAAAAAEATAAACLKLWEELCGLQALLLGGDPPADAAAAAAAAAGSGRPQRGRKRGSSQNRKSSSSAAGGRGRGSWAAGTGYGGSGGGLSKAAQAAMSAAAQRQAAADTAMSAHLAAITELLQDPLGAAGAAGPSSSRKRPRDAGPGLLTGLPWPLCGAALAGPLAWLLRLLFANDSLMDVVARQELYTAGMELMRHIGASTDLLPLLQLPADDPRDSTAPAAPNTSSSSSSASITLLAALRRLEQQAKMYRRSAEQLLAAGGDGGDGQGAEGDVDDATTAVSLALDLSDMVQGLEEGAGLYSATLQDLGQLTIKPLSATPVSATPAPAAPTGPRSSRVSRQGQAAAAAAAAAMQPQQTAGRSAAAPNPQAAAEAALEQQYVAAMQPFQFIEADLLSGGHYFAREAAAAAKQCGGGEAMRRRLKRLTEELGALSTSLPLSLDSSILLAVHNDRMDLLRALLLPHPDTPYAGGAFLFDILLPPEYPDKPPKVQFLTTGQGRWRANPNLYDCGKVCLSLLGTWSGPSWEPGVSTLLQVLVSLQSMVFVPDPYFNEPGYERSASTAAGKQASADYNMEVRLGTVSHALLPTLRTHDPVFKEALQVHYRHTGPRVRKLLQQWVREARGNSQQQLKQVVAQVQEQLDRFYSRPSSDEHHQQQRQQQQVAPMVDTAGAVVMDIVDLT